jgi:hypothetical protein
MVNLRRSLGAVWNCMRGHALALIDLVWHSMQFKIACHINQWEIVSKIYTNCLGN